MRSVYQLNPDHNLWQKWARTSQLGDDFVPLALKLCRYPHLTFAGSKRARLVAR